MLVGLFAGAGQGWFVGAKGFVVEIDCPGKAIEAEDAEGSIESSPGTGSLTRIH